MAEKRQYLQVKEDDSLEVQHFETDADITLVQKGTGKYEGNAENVQDALEEVYSMALTGGVTGVKGNEELTYRQGNVNLTPANIGAEAAFTDGSATIASESGGVVTIKAGISQTAGTIANSSASDITLGTAAKKGVATSIGSSASDNNLATEKAVKDAIDNLPEPMIFKGSVGDGGTIEWNAFPAASASNEGFTYKVITDHTNAGVGDNAPTCKIGDTLISNGTAWTVIPSGDEPSGTVTSVGIGTTVNEGLVVSGGPITSSGTLTVDLDSAYGDKKNPYGSKTKNQVLASPATVDGNPSFRALVAADIPDLSATYQPLDADLTAIAGLSGTSGLLKKTAADTWALDTNTYLTENETITISGDASGSGKTNITLTLANSGVTAGTYSAVAVNAKGLVTAGGQIIEYGTRVTDADYENLDPDEKALYDSTSSGGYHYQIKPHSTLAVGGMFLKMV